MFLDRLLNAIVIEGDLTVVHPDGRCRRYGRGSIPGVARSVIRITRTATAWRLAFDPSLCFGEAYMNGGLVVEEGDIYDFLALSIFNVARARRSGALGWSDHIGRLARRLVMHNPVARARRNAIHHYDLPSPFYRLFLDDDRQYSCAYFETPGLSLEQAQQAKKRHIAAKLLLRPGQHVLDIGCGWGGLALSLAQWADVRVTGITLSEEQLKVARLRSQAERCRQVSFQQCDYRHIDGKFDRIVSVGMFEHVGIGHYRAFFERLRDLLTDDGVALVHSIGRSDGPGVTNAWIRKYIFPGGYSPALSEVLSAVERSGLVVTDVEILRLHYAETLREWRRRFLARRDAAARQYGEPFCRMWEFYLAGSEASFRYDGMMVFQMQLARSVDTVPTCRDYVSAWKRRAVHWEPGE